MKYLNYFPNKLLSFSLLIIIFFTACQSDDEDPTPIDQYLVESEFIIKYNQATIQTFLQLGAASSPNFAFLNNYVSRVKYDISVYKITYNTIDAFGNNVIASGALLVPDTQDALPFLSQQHGTITSDEDAPSNFNQSSEVFGFGLPLSSFGYILAAPDYLGYGTTSNIDHPYEHANSLATASRDMLRASREFIRSNNFNWNNKLFLTGYSEGGGATMALHKLLEESHSDEFTVTASAPGAGAYDKSAFSKFIVEQNTDLNFLGAYIWVLGTYNNVYGLNRPETFYFQEPHASYVANTPLSQIDISQITANPQNLFTTELINGIKNDTDTDLLNAISDNNIYDWTPRAPIRMFHGTADDFVPPFNSENALQAMLNRGVNTVEYIPIQGGDHFTSLPNFLEGVVSYFDTFN